MLIDRSDGKCSECEGQLEVTDADDCSMIVECGECLSVDDVMKGRPITEEEFDRMLAVTHKVVGKDEAAAWQFALRIVWFSGFRVGDLMDFHWEDERHIRPFWSNQPGVFPTITVPSSQKNGKVQEIPMLPELDEFLSSVPIGERTGWIVERLRNAGVPPLVICRVMRHSSWETTRRHYAPGDVQKDAEQLLKYLS